jgi:hypothetical protein
VFACSDRSASDRLVGLISQVCDLCKWGGESGDKDQQQRGRPPGRRNSVTTVNLAAKKQNFSWNHAHWLIDWFCFHWCWHYWRGHTCCRHWAPENRDWGTFFHSGEGGQIFSETLLTLSGFHWGSVTSV